MTFACAFTRTVILVSVGIVALVVPTAFAQTNYTRQEIGFSSSYLGTNNYFDRNMAGLTGRYVFNLNPSLSLESAFTLFPRNTMTVAGQGGREVTWFTGLKAALRRQGWGLYAKASPGVRIFTNAPNRDPRIFSTEARRHFAVDLGGGAEVYLADRWTLRADVSEVLTRFGDNQVPPVLLPSGELLVYGYDPGRVQSAMAASIGFAYRLGELRRTPPGAMPGPFRRLEAGVQYSLANRSVDQGAAMADSSGLGGWGSVYLNSHIAIDGAVTHFWNGSPYISPQEGGNFSQALVGAKIGITREKFGAYVKVRPGLVRFSLPVTNTPLWISLNGAGGYDPVAQFAIDMGGVVEFYPSRHVVLRADFSDLTIRYGARNAIGLSAGPYRVPGYTDSAIQTCFGFGWRF